MIEFKDVHKKYGKLEVLKGVNFTIKDGGIIAILGPNGSGKTTSMKSFLGMVIPTKGDILFNGKSIKNQWAYREQISYLPQIANFPNNLKVKELIAIKSSKARRKTTLEMQLSQNVFYKNLKKAREFPSLYFFINMSLSLSNSTANSYFPSSF